MYSTRNNPIKTVLISFAAGWLFAQVFTVVPKDNPFNGVNPTGQQKAR